MLRSEAIALARELQRAVWEECVETPRVGIREWVEGTVDLSSDPTSHAHGGLRLYPYQVDPLEATETPGVRQTTFMAGQRLGKSTIWKLSLLKRIHDRGLSGMVLYPSKEEAEETNRDTVLPLIRTLARAKADLASRGNAKKDSYHLPSCRSIVYYSGASPALSKTLNWGAVDEADFHVIAQAGDEGRNTGNVAALRLRMKTFAEAMLIVVSSPTLKGGTIYEEWLKGSRGVWHLRCCGCRQLSHGNRLALRRQDGTYAGLQWAKSATGEIEQASIRWVCPHCGRPHAEGEAKALAGAGEYVHENPGKLATHRSYQAGALANPWLWTWLEIAEAQENAGSVEGRKYLYNTIRGWPYEPKRHAAAGESVPEALKGRVADLPADMASRIAATFAGVDQQATGLSGRKYYVWTVRAWCENGDSHLLACGLANSLAELESAVMEPRHGHRPLLALVDQGGFNNALDLDPFIHGRPGWLYYKGDDQRTLKGARIMRSETDAHLLLADAQHWQVELLDAVYGPQRAEGYAWHIPPDTPADYLTQVASLRPNPRADNGEAFGRWKAVDRRDYFDAEKLALVALNAALTYITAPLWPRKNLPLFHRIELLAELKRRAKLQQGGRSRPV